MLISDIYRKVQSSQRCFLEKDIFPALKVKPPVMTFIDHLFILLTVLNHRHLWAPWWAMVPAGGTPPGYQGNENKKLMQTEGLKDAGVVSVGRCFCKEGKVGQIQKSWFQQVGLYCIIYINVDPGLINPMVV